MKNIYNGFIRKTFFVFLQILFINNALAQTHKAGFGWIPFDELGTSRDRFVKDEFIEGKKDAITQLAINSHCIPGNFDIPEENFEIVQYSLSETKEPFLNKLGPGIKNALKKLDGKKDSELNIFLESHGDVGCMWSKEREDTHSYSYDIIFDRIFSQLTIFYEKNGFLPKIKIFNGACSGGSSTSALSATLDEFIRIQKNNSTYPLKERPEIILFFGAPSGEVTRKFEFQTALQEGYNLDFFLDEDERIINFCSIPTSKNSNSIWFSRSAQQKRILKKLLLSKINQEIAFSIRSMLLSDWHRSIDIFQEIFKESSLHDKELLLKTMSKVHGLPNSEFPTGDFMLGIVNFLGLELVKSKGSEKLHVAKMILEAQEARFSGDTTSWPFDPKIFSSVISEVVELIENKNSSEEIKQAAYLILSNYQIYIAELSRQEKDLKRAWKPRPTHKDIID